MGTRSVADPLHRTRTRDWLPAIREKEACEPSVGRFSGDVKPNKMPSTLRRLDAVMIPTDASCGETGSYSALEAMATGLPVIARDLLGLRFNCGDLPLYTSEDNELLARLRELDEADIRSELGSKARKSVNEEHSVHRHVAAHTAGFLRP